MREGLDWPSIVERLEFAYQPIVNIHTGACFGYEALMRGWDECGYSSPHHVIDDAYHDLELHRLDIALREKAIERFVRVPHHRSTKLFYNLDSRVLEMPDYEPGRTLDILAEYGLEPSCMCFELSERHEMSSSVVTRGILQRYKQQLYNIAIDDYGSGFSGLQLLYHSEPHFIKIDRFFVGGIENDPRKKLFVTNIVSMAHLLGIHVIAEGVETERELAACREIGCDLVQGYFIQRPTIAVGELREVYEAVRESGQLERRSPVADRLPLQAVWRPEMVRVDQDMVDVLRAFRVNDGATFIVVVDVSGSPLGIIRESSIKRFVYSQYGWALLAGSKRTDISDYLARCPIAEIHAPVERMLEMFSMAEGAEEGVILTENRYYVGFLSAGELLRAINERNLAQARDQNPLTRLPGNTLITTYLNEALADISAARVFVYFDFDNFKPFNDAYGFRQGDRAIQLFADILKSAAHGEDMFIGHVGGDDFFAACTLRRDTGVEDVRERCERMTGKFARDVQSLYSAEDRARGGISACDREGRVKPFPMLTVSTALIIMPAGYGAITIDMLGGLIADVKKAAKVARDRVAVLEFDYEDEALDEVV